MSDENLEEKILKKVYTWLALAIVGLGGGTALLGPSIIRDDPFTGTDAKFLRQEFEFECNKLESSIREDMPPPRTRKRIRAIERHLEHTSDFEVKEYNW